MGGTEFQRCIALPLDRLDDEDVPGARVDRTLQCRHADAADADDCDVLAGPDVGGARRRAVAGGHAAAHQAGHLERDRRVDLHHRALVHHHVRREGAEQRHREDVLALGLDPEGAVGDRRAVEQARAEVAQVAHAGLTRRTPPAGRDERQHHVVAGRDVLDAGPDLGDDARALMTAQHREAAHRDAAGDQVVVGVAHPRRFHLDLHLVLDGVADLDLLDRPRLVELPDESAFCLHPIVPSARASQARLEPLVRCVTPTPKQPLGRASPDRDRRLAERVVARQFLAGHAAFDSLLHALGQLARPRSAAEHVGRTWPKSKKSRCHSILPSALSRNQLPPMP